MTQGKDTFATFLPKFERTLAEAGGGEWSDDVKISTLKRILNHDLERSLIYVPVHPTKYADFVKVVYTLVSRIATLNYKVSRVAPAPTGDEID